MKNANYFSAGTAICVALLSYTSPSNAQIDVCNGTSKPVLTATQEYNSDERSARMHRGWYRIDPGTCSRLMNRGTNPVSDGFIAISPQHKEPVVRPAFTDYTTGCVKGDKFEGNLSMPLLRPNSDDAEVWSFCPRGWRMEIFGGIKARNPKVPLRFMITTQGTTDGFSIDTPPAVKGGLSSNPQTLPYITYRTSIQNIGQSKRGGGRKERNWYFDPAPGFRLCTYRAREASNQGGENAWTATRVGDRVYLTTVVTTCGNALCAGKKSSVYVDLDLYYYKPGTWTDERVRQTIDNRPQGQRGVRATRGALDWPQDVKCGDRGVHQGRKITSYEFPIVVDQEKRVTIRQTCLLTKDGSELGHVYIFGSGDSCSEARNEAMLKMQREDACTAGIYLYKRGGEYKVLDTPTCRWQ